MNERLTGTADGDRRSTAGKYCLRTGTSDNEHCTCGRAPHPLHRTPASRACRPRRRRERVDEHRYLLQKPRTQRSRCRPRLRAMHPATLLTSSRISMPDTASCRAAFGVVGAFEVGGPAGKKTAMAWPKPGFGKPELLSPPADPTVRANQAHPPGEKP